MCDSHYIYYKTNRNVPSLKLGWAALPSSKDMSSKSIAKRAANDINLEARRMAISIKSYIFVLLIASLRMEPYPFKNWYL